MRPINGTIEDDLRKLKDFASQPKIVGYVSNLWFGGLVSRYPLEYLLFSQEFNCQKFKKMQTKEQVKKRILMKLDRILEAQINKDIIDELNQIITKLETLSSKK